MKISSSSSRKRVPHLLFNPYIEKSFVILILQWRCQGVERRERFTAEMGKNSCKKDVISEDHIFNKNFSKCSERYNISIEFSSKILKIFSKFPNNFCFCPNPRKIHSMLLFFRKLKYDKTNRLK